MSAKNKKIEDLVRGLVLGLKEDDIDIYHIEYVKEFDSYYLRVYIDKEGGVFINDCEDLSRLLSEELDKHEAVLTDNYILEVSSPGLDRALHCDEHFKGAIGEMVLIKTRVKIEGKKEHLGELLEVDEENLSIKCDDGTYTIERDKITKANVYFA